MTDRYTLENSEAIGGQEQVAGPAALSSTRENGIRGGGGGRGQGATGETAVQQSDIDQVVTGKYSDFDSSRWRVTRQQSSFDLSNWPQGYGTDPDMYSDSPTHDHPSNARAEVLLTGVEMDRILSGGEVTYTLTSPNGATTNLTVSVPDPGDSGHGYWGYYNVVFWVGKFPYELNEPGTYTIDIGGDFGSGSASVDVQNPSPVRYSGLVPGNTAQLDVNTGVDVWGYDYVDKQWDIYGPSSEGNPSNFSCEDAKRVAEEAGFYNEWESNLENEGLLGDVPCVGPPPIDESKVEVWTCDVSDDVVDSGQNVDLFAQVTNQNSTDVSVDVHWYAGGKLIGNATSYVGPNTGTQVENRGVSHGYLLDHIGAGNYDDFHAEIDSVSRP